ncbi:MAG: hypothetical protein ABSA03_08520 [Streptosporangiaceae bacterium]|jgi:hypothetical protein
MSPAPAAARPAGPPPVVRDPGTAGFTFTVLSKSASGETLVTRHNADAPCHPCHCYPSA